MSFWKGLGRFILTVLAVVGGLLAVLQWAVRLKISTWVIPDWILLVLIVVLFSVTAYALFWINRVGKPESQRGLRKKLKLKPNKEHMFILSALAESEDQSAVRGFLKDCYMRVFEKSITDFNVIFNELREPDYIATCGNEVTADCLITASGLCLFKKHQDYFVQKGGGIPPVPPDIKESYRLGEAF